MSSQRQWVISLLPSLVLITLLLPFHPDKTAASQGQARSGSVKKQSKERVQQNKGKELIHSIIKGIHHSLQKSIPVVVEAVKRSPLNDHYKGKPRSLLDLAALYLNHLAILKGQLGDYIGRTSSFLGIDAPSPSKQVFVYDPGTGAGTAVQALDDRVRHIAKRLQVLEKKARNLSHRMNKEKKQRVTQQKMSVETEKLSKKFMQDCADVVEDIKPLWKEIEDLGIS